MKNHSLEVSRIGKAPIERVWQAWTNPSGMKQWQAPEGFADEKSKEMHRQGWESTFNKLETHVM